MIKSKNLLMRLKNRIAMNTITIIPITVSRIVIHALPIVHSCIEQIAAISRNAEYAIPIVIMMLSTAPSFNERQWLKTVFRSEAEMYGISAVLLEIKISLNVPLPPINVVMHQLEMHHSIIGKTVFASSLKMLKLLSSSAGNEKQKPVNSADRTKLKKRKNSIITPERIFPFFSRFCTQKPSNGA